MRHANQRPQLIGAAFVSVTFIVIRTLYGFIFEFSPDPWETPWNPVLGSALTYGLMAMSTEFLALFFQLVPFGADIKIPSHWRSRA